MVPLFLIEFQFFSLFAFSRRKYDFWQRWCYVWLSQSKYNSHVLEFYDFFFLSPFAQTMPIALKIVCTYDAYDLILSTLQRETKQCCRTIDLIGATNLNLLNCSLCVSAQPTYAYKVYGIQWKERKIARRIQINYVQTKNELLIKTNALTAESKAMQWTQGKKWEI